MTLSNIGWLGFSLGAVVIGGVLFLLQRLRVRHHERTVLTTLFWKEAIEQTRARVVFHRFRHPWAFLLICCIAGLMWLAFSEPRTPASFAQRHVVVLDASARMAIGDRFEKAVESVQRLAAKLPRDATTVVYAGAERSTLLAPNESLILLRERLKSLQPEASPSQLESCIRQLVRTQDEVQQTRIYLVGASAIDERFRELLPERVSLTRVGEDSASQGEKNSGVTQLGVAAANSGRWNQVDAIVELHTADAEIAKRLSVTLGEQAWPGVVEQIDATQPDAGGQRQITLRIADLPADGQLLRIQLSDADVLAFDDEAEIYLPNQPLIRVTLEGLVPDSIRQVLELDPAVDLVTDGSPADVRVTSNSSSNEIPSLVLRDDTAEYAFAFAYQDKRDAGEVVQFLFHNLGLDQIDAQQLAEATGKVIRLGAERSETRRVLVWRSLLSPDFNFTRSQAFPLFVGQAVRWLASQKPVVDHAAAGESIEMATETHFLEKRRLSTGGRPFTPPRVGRYQSVSGTPVAASLLDLSASRDQIALERDSSESIKRSWPVSLVTLLGGLCLALVFVEWYLFRKGRMP